MGVAACTGPRPICAGSRPAHWLSTMRPRGRRFHLATAASEASTSIAAPSVTCELLPAVMLPQGLSKTGLSLASFSGVESSRTPSSSGYSLPWVSMSGVISVMTPAARAASAR
ncbi:hypothetical protein G6F24_018405 [Rhizopus arrhizus]|nr:hypothetical protein G6F24_018405 [Rhizopus arrhizus]